MLWDHTAYCRRCRRRVFVAPRRYSLAGDRLLMAVTLGLWALMRRWRPQRFGLWQCDECGSHACVAARRVKLDEQGRRMRPRKRRSRSSAAAGVTTRGSGRRPSGGRRAAAEPR